MRKNSVNAVEIINAADGASALNSTIGGDYDITFSSYVPIFAAQAKGIAQLKIVADCASSVPNTCMIMASPQSNVRTPQDLGGNKRIAISGEGTISKLMVQAAMRSHGVDYNRVQWVPIGFPNMPNALAANQVDAAFVVEPFLTLSARNARAIPVVRALAAELGPDLLPRERADTAAAFHRVEGLVLAFLAIMIAPAARLGIGGPVGSGKTALVDALCKRMRDTFDIAVDTAVAIMKFGGHAGKPQRALEGIGDLYANAAVGCIERLFVDADRHAYEYHVCPVVLSGRAVVTLEREEAVFGVQEIADALASDGVVERSQHEKAAGDRLTCRQRQAGGDTILLNFESRHSQHGART